MNKPFQYRPLFYFSITFLSTFAFWLVGAYFSHQPGQEGMYMLFMLPGMMAPFLISLAMIFTSKDAYIKKDFINRLVNIKLIRPKMLPVMILIMPATILVSITVSLFFGQSASQFQLAEGFSFSTGFVPVLLLLLLAASFEELGWRGYAFDSLEDKYRNYLIASLVFSVLWSFWHFPLVFVNDSYQYEIVNESIWYGVNFFVSIIPMGVIISWFCIKNGKSVIAAILFHFIINMSQELLEITQITKCIETVVLTIVVIAIVALDRELFFSPKRAKDDLPSLSAAPGVVA